MERNNSKNLENILTGDLVEYRDPLPEFQNLVGVVLRVREIESNVYERGYVEADVHWTNRRYHSARDQKRSLYETHEDVSRLTKLSS